MQYHSITIFQIIIYNNFNSLNLQSQKKNNQSYESLQPPKNLRIHDILIKQLAKQNNETIIAIQSQKKYKQYTNLVKQNNKLFKHHKRKQTHKLWNCIMYALLTIQC